MKHWLIMFIMSPHGDYIGKQEIVYANKAVCVTELNHIKRSPREDIKVDLICVSDAHHSGRAQDPGVSYD